MEGFPIRELVLLSHLAHNFNPKRILGLPPRGYKLEQRPKLQGLSQDFEFWKNRVRTFLRAQHTDFDEAFQMIDRHNERINFPHLDERNETQHFWFKYSVLMETYLIELASREAHTLVLELIRYSE